MAGLRMTLLAEEIERLTRNPCGCCGDEITERNPDPWEGRLDGYCEDCATARCDAYPGECGKPRTGNAAKGQQPSEGA